MRKIAFVFPGQGAQYIGMGKDFYDNIPVSRQVYELASDTVELDIPHICFEDNNQINITEYTQIAMLTTSVAMQKALEERGIRSEVNAGLSLGEYGAIVASDIMKTEDAFKIVRKRGILMQQAVPKGGAMAAVLGMEADKIKKICESCKGVVSIANYNCPGQIVITGEEASVASACSLLKEAGAKRTLMLNVSGPFHSKLLNGAGEKLVEELQEIPINDIIIPYVSNVTAKYVTDKNQVKQLLGEQVSSSVKWEQSVKEMIANGVDTFIEIGPGKTLSSFMRKIDRNVTMLNIEKITDIDTVVNVLS